jgi:hypothetical protein
MITFVSLPLVPWANSAISLVCLSSYDADDHVDDEDVHDDDQHHDHDKSK